MTPSATKAKFHIRWMIRRDMPEVLAIESDSFELSWSKDDFIDCLRQRNCIGMVVDWPARKTTEYEKVVGFMLYELHKTHLHILDFVVHRCYRRLGVGSAMVNKLIYKLSPSKQARILLETHETNLSAQLFFRANGFYAKSVLRDYYPATDEDAYLMEYEPKDRKC